MSDMRICLKCGDEKPVNTAFYWKNRKAFGQCKDCRNTYQRGHRKTSEIRERRRADLAQYRRTPIGAEVHRAARRRGIAKLLTNGPTIDRASKLCPECGSEKPIDDFGLDRYKPDGRRGYCKPCEVVRGRAYAVRNPERVRRNARASRLRTKYGLTPEDFDALLAAQGHRCAICSADEAAVSGRWVVDHCHKTGRVRGILCNRCNRGIGRLGDDPFRIRVAAAYLAQHRC